MSQYQRPMLAALKLAITELEKARRKFSTGHHAYLHGIRPKEVEGEGISGVTFDWVERDYHEHERYTKAIQQLEDLQEVLEDPGVQHTYQLPLISNSGPEE